MYCSLSKVVIKWLYVLVLCPKLHVSLLSEECKSSHCCLPENFTVRSKAAGLPQSHGSKDVSRMCVLEIMSKSTASCCHSTDELIGPGYRFLHIKACVLVNPMGALGTCNDPDEVSQSKHGHHLKAIWC